MVVATSSALENSESIRFQRRGDVDTALRWFKRRSLEERLAEDAREGSQKKHWVLDTNNLRHARTMLRLAPQDTALERVRRLTARDGQFA